MVSYTRKPVLSGSRSGGGGRGRFKQKITTSIKMNPD
jgi:hypothetical protein